MGRYQVALLLATAASCGLVAGQASDGRAVTASEEAVAAQINSGAVPYVWHPTQSKWAPPYGALS